MRVLAVLMLAVAFATLMYVVSLTFYDMTINYKIEPLPAMPTNPPPSISPKVNTTTIVTNKGKTAKTLKHTSTLPPLIPKQRIDVHAMSMQQKQNVTLPLVISGTPFNREADIFEIRLHELGDAVDYHIVVESMYTQYGLPKPLRFNLSKYTNFQDKIIYVVLTQQHNSTGCALGWAHESWVRSSIVHLGIPMLEDKIKRRILDSDVLIVTDVDEIPRSTVVHRLKTSLYPKNFTVVFQMRYSLYGFFWLNQHSSQVAYATTVSHAQKRRKTHKVIPNAGWHCGLCVPPKEYNMRLKDYLCGDGLRWGDFDWPLDTIHYLRSTGTWFGALPHSNNVKRVTENDTMRAPEYALNIKDHRFDYLLHPPHQFNVSYKPFMGYCNSKQVANMDKTHLRQTDLRMLNDLIKAWCK